jgi:hypothetical protein
MKFSQNALAYNFHDKSRGLEGNKDDTIGCVYVSLMITLLYCEHIAFFITPRVDLIGDYHIVAIH